MIAKTAAAIAHTPAARPSIAVGEVHDVHHPDEPEDRQRLAEASRSRRRPRTAA